MPGVTIKLPFVDIHLSSEEQSGLADRFTREALYRGPCLIMNRDTGLALDAGPDSKTGDHTCLWQTHAAPWQQWRIQPVGGGDVEIVSESSGRKLTKMAQGFDWVKPGWTGKPSPTGLSGGGLSRRTTGLHS